MPELRWEHELHSHGKRHYADCAGRYLITRPTRGSVPKFSLKYNGKVIYESGSVDLCKAYALKHCNREAK